MTPKTSNTQLGFALHRATWPIAIGVAIALAWLAIQWDGSREVSANDAVSAAYQGFLSLDTLRYTRSTERYACPHESSANEETGLPLHSCQLTEEHATGEVVLPDSWYERTAVSNVPPIELGKDGPKETLLPDGTPLVVSRSGTKEMIVTDGTPYLKSGANWVKRADLRFRYEFARYFMLDTPSFLDDSRPGFSYEGEARVDGAVTKHYRSYSEGWGYATTLEVWVGVEDGVPRKILRRTEALADAPPQSPEPPIELANGIRVLIMIDKWKSDTIVFYDFNNPISIESPRMLK